MGKMMLTAGEKVIACFYPQDGNPCEMLVTITGFTSYGVRLEHSSWSHWHTDRNWYGCGYHNDGYIIYIRAHWQKPYACIFELVRLGEYSRIKIWNKKRKWKRRDITDVMVLKAYQKYKARELKGKPPYDDLVDSTGAPFKVVWRAIERTERRGYLDYGTSLRTAWITESGYSILSSQ